MWASPGRPHGSRSHFPNVAFVKRLAFWSLCFLLSDHIADFFVFFQCSKFPPFEFSLLADFLLFFNLAAAQCHSLRSLLPSSLCFFFFSFCLSLTPRAFQSCRLIPHKCRFHRPSATLVPLVPAHKLTALVSVLAHSTLSLAHIKWPQCCIVLHYSSDQRVNIMRAPSIPSHSKSHYLTSQPNTTWSQLPPFYKAWWAFICVKPE